LQEFEDIKDSQDAKTAFIKELLIGHTEERHDGVMITIIQDLESHFTLFDAPDNRKGEYYNSLGKPPGVKLKSLVVELITGLRKERGIANELE